MKNPLNAFRKTLQIPYSITAEGIWEAVLRRPTDLGDKLRTGMAQERGTEGEAAEGKTERRPPVIAGLLYTHTPGLVYTHTTPCLGNRHSHAVPGQDGAGICHRTARVCLTSLVCRASLCVYVLEYPLLFVCTRD